MLLRRLSLRIALLRRVQTDARPVEAQGRLIACNDCVRSTLSAPSLAQTSRAGSLRAAARLLPTVSAMYTESETRYSSAFVALAFLPFLLVAHAEEAGPEAQEVCVLATDRSPTSLQRLSSLLAKGASANSRHPAGWTALQAAVVSDNNRAARMLLEKGASPNDPDNYIPRGRAAFFRQTEFSTHVHPHVASEGMTALHYAALFGLDDIVAVLLEHGADPTLKTKGGHTPADCAAEPRLQKLLREHDKKFVAAQEEDARRKRTENPLHVQLKKHIIGQDAPIDAVSAAIRRRQNGWHDEDHPLVFLFLGSSGVGKTELAKRTAEFLHGSSNTKAFIRCDMSEYQEKHEVAKFIGAPPGYIGHDEGGQLVNGLRACPNAVVLLDEVEKAHTDVLTALLQLFDEGRLTDSKGNTVDCKEAIFIMTSNLAQDHIAEFATEFREENGPNAPIYPSRAFKQQVIRPILKGHFVRDEFLGRIHEVLYFWPFSEQQMHLLVDKELAKWAQRAKERHDIELVWDERVVSVLVRQYNIHFGARSLQHAVNRIVINKIAQAHEENRLKRGDKVRLVPVTGAADADDDDVDLEIASPGSSAGSWLPWRQ